MKKTKQSWKALIMLQFAVLIYTFAGIFGKLASGYPVLSLPFIGLYAAEVVVLGIYAILWQQVIRHIDLSVAYANKGISLLWSLLWALLLFHETITIGNVLGILVVMAGIFLVNSEPAEQEDTNES